MRQRGVGSGAKEGVESESGGLRVRQKGVESVNCDRGGGRRVGQRGMESEAGGWRVRRKGVESEIEGGGGQWGREGMESEAEG